MVGFEDVRLEGDPSLWRSEHLIKEFSFFNEIVLKHHSKPHYRANTFERCALRWTLCTNEMRFERVY